MGKAILLSAASLLLALDAAARADNDGGTIRLGRWLDTVQAPLSIEGLVPSTGLIPMEPGKKPHIYVRLLPHVDIIDGGPNIDDATSGSDRYKDAFGGGFGLNVEIWGRFVPNIYLILHGGATLFEGGRGLETIDGYGYHLDDLSLSYISIGGAFAAPLENLWKDTGETDELEGLVGTFLFCGGVVFAPAVDMTIDSSPPLGTDLTGMKLEYWKARAGFVGMVSLGFEYRVGPFALILDLGIRTFGRPVPATEPRWWSAGQTMITYPIRFGASYRF